MTREAKTPKPAQEKYSPVSLEDAQKEALLLREILAPAMQAKLLFQLKNDPDKDAQKLLQLLEKSGDTLWLELASQDLKLMEELPNFARLTEYAEAKLELRATLADKKFTDEQGVTYLDYKDPDTTTHALVRLLENLTQLEILECKRQSKPFFTPLLVPQIIVNEWPRLFPEYDIQHEGKLFSSLVRTIMAKIDLEETDFGHALKMDLKTAYQKDRAFQKSRTQQ